MSDMQKVKLRGKKTKGFTQQQMADMLPTDVSNYSRKEAGTVGITKQNGLNLQSF
jgi:transcriptional regulator